MVRTDSRRRRAYEVQEVSFALLHLHDLVSLSESRLCDMPEVQERARGSRALFAEAEALQAFLVPVVQGLLERLPQEDTHLARIRATLSGVALSGKSVAQVAREHGRSREYWSRSYWREAISLVARELASRKPR